MANSYSVIQVESSRRTYRKMKRQEIQDGKKKRRKRKCLMLMIDERHNLMRRRILNYPHQIKHESEGIWRCLSDDHDGVVEDHAAKGIGPKRHEKLVSDRVVTSVAQAVYKRKT
ncbi:hypothetical protein Tco_1019430 [Tanacetum coccineum]|uniref:Uncharacterized protein n=1 Tax=Tanacetum coccineum TaxID=301880 RepID=A0ABQ5FYJ5_9ASTR